MSRRAKKIEKRVTLDPKFNSELVAHMIRVVMKDGTTLDVDALLQFLGERLAKYKIPAYVFQYDAFPLLSNGKVDAIELKRSMNERAAAQKRDR